MVSVLKWRWAAVLSAVLVVVLFATVLVANPLTAQVEPLTCNGLTPTIVGTDGDDVLQGTWQDDVIVGLGGSDTITGASGNDTICGGDGADIIDGQSGDDTIFGDGGNDQIRGSSGDDTIDGGASWSVSSGLTGWHHYVVTIEDGVATAYLDGVSLGDREVATLNTSAGPVNFGSSEGSFDELAIYDRALTPTEINEHYDVSNQ